MAHLRPAAMSAFASLSMQKRTCEGTDAFNNRVPATAQAADSRPVEAETNTAQEYPAGL
jgi:hypothetical protein